VVGKERAATGTLASTKVGLRIMGFDQGGGFAVRTDEGSSYPPIRKSMSQLNDRISGRP
jgi:hypothetical protein